MLFGCDFSSAPSRRKPIVVAIGTARRGAVLLERFEYFTTLDAWGAWLQSTPAWTGGFDFPFGLPRELVSHLGWPTDWHALIAHYTALDRAEIRAIFAGFCAARPVGGKFAHRATDRPAGSSSSMKWVNPPVAYMLHAGVPRLLAARAVVPGLHAPADAAPRVALEAYPGLLARELLGRRSYKSDEAARQTAERTVARAELLQGLEAGASRLGTPLQLAPAQREELLDDARGDRIDAVLCLVQAAWASGQPRDDGPGYGLPKHVDPLEGWIISA